MRSLVLPAVICGALLLTGCRSEQLPLLDSSEVPTPTDSGTPGGSSQLKLSIESAPDGLGSPVQGMILEDGAPISLHAVIRDGAGQFVGNASVRWNADHALGFFSNSVFASTVFTPGANEGETVFRASKDGMSSAQTGTIQMIYTPAQIRGLVGWYRGDSGVGRDESGGVLSWEDRSGRNRIALQGAGGSRPQWLEGAVNGKPALRFDGTDDWLGLENAGGEDESRYTLFVVYRSDVSGDLDPEGSFVPARRMAPGGGGGQFILGTLRQSTAQSQAFSNGSLRLNISGTTGRAGSILRYIGRNPEDAGSASSFQGEIAEILIYNAALTDSLRQAIESYLNRQYGL